MNEFGDKLFVPAHWVLDTWFKLRCWALCSPCKIFRVLDLVFVGRGAQNGNGRKSRKGLNDR